VLEGKIAEIKFFSISLGRVRVIASAKYTDRHPLSESDGGKSNRGRLAVSISRVA
jgi:hypothetical protein